MNSGRGQALLAFLELKRSLLKKSLYLGERDEVIDKPLIVSDEEYFEILRENKKLLNKKKTR